MSLLMGRRLLSQQLRSENLNTIITGGESNIDSGLGHTYSHVNSNGRWEHAVNAAAGGGGAGDYAGMYKRFVRGFKPGGAGASALWDTSVQFMIKACYMNAADASSVRYILFGQEIAYNVNGLTALGVGIKIINTALWGMNYGAALTLTDLATTLANNTVAHFRIVHNPGVSVQFYIDGLLKGTSTTNLPSGNPSGDLTLLINVLNGATDAARAIRVFDEALVVTPRWWSF